MPIETRACTIGPKMGMKQVEHPELSRRAAMGVSLALAAMPQTGSARDTLLSGGGAVNAQRRHWTSEFLSFDPFTNFRQAMRLQRSLVPEDSILNWYHFIMFAVVPGRAPAPVVRWEGIELSHHRWLRPDLLRAHGHNLSFPRDLETGALVEDALNPITGRRVGVSPMALTNDPGMFMSPRGILSLDDKSGTFRPKYAKIRREGDQVKIDGVRVPPATWPTTFLEVGYETTPAKLFGDASLQWLPTELSGAYVFPFPDWMEMDDEPGHMFAAWSGHKLRTVDELPRQFRAEAEARYPELLKVDTSVFARQVEIPQS